MSLSLHSKITNGYYTPKLGTPKKPIRPVLAPSANSKLAADYVINLRQYEKEIDRWTKAIKDHQADQARLQRLFRHDLEVEFGVKDHPKADHLWLIAYSRGHDEGLHQVYAWYQELVVLLV